MLDFSKLNDPEHQAQVRKELDEQEARRQASVAELKALADRCEAAELSDKERSFIRSCQRTLVQRLSLTAPQETWLRDIAARL